MEGSIHHTRSQGPPPYSELDEGINGSNNQSQVSTHVNLGKPGRLAARWIVDILSGSLNDNDNILQCFGLDVPVNASHDLWAIKSQSNLDESPLNGRVLSSLCKVCKKHFVFRVFCDDSKVCDGKTERMHHLVLSDVQSAETSSQTKHYPLIGQVAYRCSAITCSLRIVVDVSKPRLSMEHIRLLTDREPTLRRLDELRAREPDRFADFAENQDKKDRLVPVIYLDKYLSDLLKPSARAAPSTQQDGLLKIRSRNKIFQLCFADGFDSMFEYMEFETGRDDDDQFLVVPKLEAQAPGIVEFRSRRAFFEDLNLQVAVVVNDLPVLLSNPGQIPNDLVRAKEYLITMLNAKYPKSKADYLETYEKSDFTVLGAVYDMHESLLRYACQCQNQTCPTMRKHTFSSLTQIAQPRLGSEVGRELHDFLEQEGYAVALEASAVDLPDDLRNAYQYFDIELPGAITEPDRLILEHCQAHVTSYDTTESRKKYRQYLAIIGRARNSQWIINAVKTFTPDEAAEYLVGQKDADLDFIASVVSAYVDTREIDRELASSALRTLAKKHPDNTQLLQTADELERTCTGADDNSITVNVGNSQTEAVNLSMPVGLVNIRNTCYLNSILQYFNTVVAVRDVVLNWEDYKLEPTEENIKARRLGGSGTVLSDAEAFLAQKFVEEMRALFLNLQDSPHHAIRPRQQLALAALKTADKLMEGKSSQKPENVGMQPLPAPPPLPARPSPKPPVESGQPIVTVNPIPEHAETASNVSSQTLVSLNEDEPSTTTVTVAKSDDGIPWTTKSKTRTKLDDSDDEYKGRQSDGDVEMVDAGAVHKIEFEKVKPNAADLTGSADSISEDGRSIEKKIEEALNDNSVTGTDQQDVEEVMGNIVEHLHAAIKPKGTDPDTGKQTDLITETFYWSSVTKIRETSNESGKASSEYRPIPDLTRWVTAYPANNHKIDLYEALDSNFDQQFTDSGQEQFTSITKASPIVHIYVQRGQTINGAASRNNEPIEIPEVLYLDRYMDSPDGSELFKKRKRCWNLKRRLALLADPLVPTKKIYKQESINEPEYDVVDEFEKTESMAFNTRESQGIDEYVSILKPELSALVDAGFDPGSHLMDISMSDSEPEDIQNLHPAQSDPDLLSRVLSLSHNDEAPLREELATLFSDMKEHAYRLHAVICHGGGDLKYGHYWVWIYDFAEDVWRKYNDDRVQVHADKNKVLAELNGSGNPYYLAYVRDDDVGRLVQIPKRTATAPAPAEPAALGDNFAPTIDLTAGSSAIGDVNAKDVEMPSVEHID